MHKEKVSDGSMSRKKVTRRRPGEGSVYQRKDGRWVAEITLEDGSRKQYYFKKEADAVAKKTQLLYEMKQGVLATGPQQKLGNYLEEWFENVQKRTLRLSSVLRYRGLLNNHILPALGHIQLQKLTAQKLQSFYTHKLDEGQSASSVHSMQKILHKALDNAVKWKLVSSNVSSGVTLPPENPRKAQTLTPEQALQLLKAVQGHELETFVTLAFVAGMRHAELTGLRWSDLNFEEESLQVNSITGRLGKYKYVEGEPKTAKGKRKINLPHFIMDMLKVHRTRQLEARLKAGEKWQDKNLVFCNRHGGFLHPNQVRMKFYRILENAGLPPMHLHDLRHSAATLMLGMGIHPKIVQERLGHSHISMTMERYSQVLPSMQKEVAEKLDDLFRDSL